MNTALVRRDFKRGSLEWKIIQRWTVFSGRERRRLSPEKRGIFNQKIVTDSITILIRALKAGDLGKYEYALWIPYRPEQSAIVGKMWEKFKQEERFLFAEFELSR